MLNKDDMSTGNSRPDGRDGRRIRLICEEVEHVGMLAPGVLTVAKVDKKGGFANNVLII